MLYGKLKVDSFYTSDLLCPNMKISPALIEAKPNCYLISDNPNANVGIVDCSLYTCRIVLKNDRRKKRMEMLASTPVDFNFLETLT